MLRATSTQLSFYGNHIYDRVIPNNHFLKLLDKTVDFSFVNDGKEFSKVVDSKSKMTTADKAYDNKKKHRLLRRKGVTSSIIIKRNRKSRCLKRIVKLLFQQGCFEPSKLDNFHQGVTASISG